MADDPALGSSRVAHPERDPSYGVRSAAAPTIHRRIGRYRDHVIRPAPTRKLIAILIKPQLAPLRDRGCPRIPYFGLMKEILGKQLGL
jgi:hypothetical protein